MEYSYYEAVKSDVIDYIDRHITLSDYAGRRDDLYNELRDDSYLVNIATGNAVGSYTCDGYRAREYCTADMDTVMRALNKLGIKMESIVEQFLMGVWEYLDVVTRYYVLVYGQAIDEALDKFEDELEEEVEEYKYYGDRK